MKKMSRIYNLIMVLICFVLLFALHYRGMIYTAVYPVFRDIGQYRLSKSVANYDIIEHDNFSISSYGEDENNIDNIQQIIDEYGDKVFGYFNYHTSKRIDVIVFPSKQELYSTLKIDDDKSTIGAYFGGKVNLLSVDVLEKSGEDSSILTNVFVHELTHLVIDNMTRGNYPLWFTEGSALYMEYYLLGYEWGALVEDMRPFSMDKLTYEFDKLDDFLSYKQSFLLVKGIIETYGKDKYIELIRKLGQGVDFSAACRLVLGVQPDELLLLTELIQ